MGKQAEVLAETSREIFWDKMLLAKKLFLGRFLLQLIQP